LPGAPGRPGETSGNFLISDDCKDMGPVPAFGALGSIPNPPSRGNGSSGQPGKVEVQEI
jgi:hypothetical protein